MIKISSSLYKMPYFNIESQTLKSINRRKDDFQEIVCVCGDGDGCETPYGGYKYNFKYQASPTIEPVSYRLKGWNLDASLNYNDIGVDAETPIMEEVQNKLNVIGNGIETSILNYTLNHFNNWQLSNKIFLKTNSIIYKHEVYDPLDYLNIFVPSIVISSEIYTVNIQLSIVYWGDGDPLK